jgi:hypothetical protein
MTSYESKQEVGTRMRWRYKGRGQQELSSFAQQLAVHFPALSGNRCNLIANIRVSAQESAKIAPAQRRELAVVERRDVGRPGQTAKSGPSLQKNRPGLA